MTPRRTIGIAAGGVAGAAVRWAVLTSVTPDGAVPWPVLVLNVVGSFVLGVVLAEEWTHPHARFWLHDVAGIGFCGGLTTFSTFAVEVVDLLRDDEVTAAVVYGLTSVTLSIAAVVAGAAMLRQVRAIQIPLEEAP